MPPGPLDRRDLEAFPAHARHELVEQFFIPDNADIEYDLRDQFFRIDIGARVQILELGQQLVGRVNVIYDHRVVDPLFEVDLAVEDSVEFVHTLLSAIPQVGVVGHDATELPLQRN